jgi:hypothetical protein
MKDQRIYIVVSLVLCVSAWLVFVETRSKATEKERISLDNKDPSGKSELAVHSNRDRKGGSRELKPVRKLDSQGRIMLTLEEAGEELRKKGIVYEKARQSEKLTSSQIEEIRSHMVPLIRQYDKERPKIEKFGDAYHALDQVVHLGLREHFKHSFFDDGNIIFLWSGHSDTPPKGYAVRKADAKYFKWSLEEDGNLAASFSPESDLGYFSEEK